MGFTEPIRVLSDLHLGHRGSRLMHAKQLDGVLAGAGTVVFNGDIVEALWEEERAEAQQHLADLQALCARHGVTAVFLNGNHDPAISTRNHLDLAGGAVFVTHGDVLFEEISPWSRYAPHLEVAHREALAASGPAHPRLSEIERRLHASKQASLQLELMAPGGSSGRLGKLSLVARELWPPWRPVRILKVWMRTPALAADFLRTFRPRARFIVIGHTHCAGIWRRGPRVVINTGGFLPSGGCRALDLAGDTLAVYRLRRGKKGFEIGRLLARYQALPLSDHECLL